MENNINQLHSLLQTSINQYTRILQLMESITQSKKSLSIEELIQISKKILKQQTVATEADKTLWPLLSESLVEPTDDNKIKQRAELIEKIIGLNKIITPKLTNIKSLMASELQQVKTGRSAIKGYQQTEIQHGRNLNNTL